MNKWDNRFLELAYFIANWSKDPKRHVGCVIVDTDRNIISTGYNGFPRDVKDDERLFQVEVKLKIIVHAEANAIANAARNGHALLERRLYVSRPVCSQCAGLIIQSGIGWVCYPAGIVGREESKWSKDWEIALGVMAEGGVQAYEI